MKTELLRQLPRELIFLILLFDRRFILRHGKLLTINKINLSHYQSLIFKSPICLSEYGEDYEHKEFSIYFSNSIFRLFYDEFCNKIVFEKTRERKTIWHIYYLR
jgi:hypothetical protein